MRPECSAIHNDGFLMVMPDCPALPNIMLMDLFNDVLELFAQGYVTFEEQEEEPDVEFGGFLHDIILDVEHLEDCGLVRLQTHAEAAGRGISWNEFADRWNTVGFDLT